MMGGVGFIKDYPVEKFFRDAKIGECTVILLWTKSCLLHLWKGPGELGQSWICTWMVWCISSLQPTWLVIYIAVVCIMISALLFTPSTQVIWLGQPFHLIGAWVNFSEAQGLYILRFFPLSRSLGHWIETGVIEGHEFDTHYDVIVYIFAHIQVKSMKVLHSSN